MKYRFIAESNAQCTIRILDGFLGFGVCVSNGILFGRAYTGGDRCRNAMRSRSVPQVTAGQAVERAPMTWRQTLIGVGMFSLVIALFVAIGFKEQASVVLVGKILGGVGLATMAVGLVANVIHAISSKATEGVRPTVPGAQPPDPDAGARRGPARDRPASPGCPTIPNPRAVRRISFRPPQGLVRTVARRPTARGPSRLRHMEIPPHVPTRHPLFPARARPVRRIGQAATGPWEGHQTDGRGVPPGRAASDCARLIAGVRLPRPSAPRASAAAAPGPFRQTGVAPVLPCDRLAISRQGSQERSPRTARDAATHEGTRSRWEYAGPGSGEFSRKVAAGPAGSARPGDSAPLSGDRTRG